MEVNFKVVFYLVNWLTVLIVIGLLLQLKLHVVIIASLCKVLYFFAF